MAATLSNLIESLSTIKARKKELELDLKETEKEIAVVEGQIFAAMDAEGVVESKSAVAKVAITSAQYPQVEAWPKLEEFIYDQKAIFLLEKRVAVLAYREFLALNRPVPGVLPFTKRKLTYKES